MSLNIGDATLSFLGDTTQLDQVFARVPEQAAASMSAAAASVTQVGTAAQGVSFELDATAENAAYAGGAIKDGMDKGAGSLHEAHGALLLVENTLGVHLPRALTNLLAHIPIITEAFSGMLPLIGAVAAIAVVAKLIEHHEALARAQEKAALEVENLRIKEDDHTKSMELENLKLDDQIAKLEGRPTQNRLKEAMLETSIASDALATAFSKDFEKVDGAIESATGFMTRFFQDMHSWGDLLAAGPGQVGAAWDRVINGTKNTAAALELVYNQLLLINKLRMEQVKATGEDEEVAAAQALGRAYNVLAQLQQRAFDVVQTEAPKSREAMMHLSEGIASATAAEKDFGLQVENIHKHARLAADQDADEAKRAAEKAAAARKKADEEVIKSINSRITEEQKEYKRETDAALKSVEEELKARHKAEEESLKLAHEKLQGQIADVDGEIKAREEATKKQEQLLQDQYSKGLISGKLYLSDLQGLYQQETQELIAALNRKEQLVILEAKNEAAQRGKIITDADAKELKAYQDLENKKAQILIQADIRMEKQEEKVEKDTAKRFAQMGQLLKAYGAELEKSGSQARAWGAGIGEAIAAVTEAYAAGSISIEQALAKIAAAEIQAIVKIAEKKGIEQMAEGFGSWPDVAAMAHHFAAAGLWFSLGGAMAAGSAALSGAGSSSNKAASGSSPAMTTGNAATQPATNPGQSVNVPHLASGGLISGPTLAMLGESSGREAVLPLNDGNAMNMIAEAISRHLNTGGGGTNFYIKGMVSSDTVGKMAKKLTRQVQTGRTRLTASNTHKITRRA